jgi:hypothetical protein
MSIKKSIQDNVSPPDNNYQTYSVNYPVKMIYNDGLKEQFIEKNRERIYARDINVEFIN